MMIPGREGVGGRVAFHSLVAAFAIPATHVPSTAFPDPRQEPYTYATSTGLVCTPSTDTTEGRHAAHPVSEIRRLSGLTFEQLATIFGVTRRTLHLWQSGQRMLPANEEHVQRVLAAVQRIDRGTADATRSALLGDGARGVDLLAKGDYEAAVRLIGAGNAQRATRPTYSEQLRAERTPPPPSELIDTTQSTPHPTVRTGRRHLTLKAALTPETEMAEEDGLLALPSEVEGLVVVSQTCDIARKYCARPFVDISPLCRPSARDLAEARRRTNTRLACLPGIPDGLAVDLERTMTVEKSVVADWQRTPGWSDDQDLRRFQEVLARRRARFAFPIEFVEFRPGPMSGRLDSPPP